MKKISTIFKVIFNSKEFSDLNILCFTDDHVQRLVDNNISSIHDQMISDTSVLFYEFLNLQRNKGKNENAKSKQTKEVQQIINELKEMIRKMEGYVRSQVSKQSEIYQSLFPNGLSEYCRINRSNIESLLNRVIFYLRTQEELVAPEIMENINNLYDEYKNEREEHLRKKMEHKQIICENRDLRTELALQLQRNLYNLAILHLGDTDKADHFFNEKLLSSKRLKSFEYYKSGKVFDTKLNKPDLHR